MLGKQIAALSLSGLLLFSGAVTAANADEATPIDTTGYAAAAEVLAGNGVASSAATAMQTGSGLRLAQASGLLSRIGQLRHCNSQKIREKYVDPIGVRILKEVVRNESKRRQCAGKCVFAGGAA